MQKVYPGIPDTYAWKPTPFEQQKVVALHEAVALCNGLARAGAYKVNGHEWRTSDVIEIAKEFEQYLRSSA